MHAFIHDSIQKHSHTIAKGKDRLACMYKTSGAKCKWSKKLSACVLKKKSKK